MLTYPFMTILFGPTVIVIGYFLFQPPFVPKVMYEGDSSNFDDYPESDWKSARTLEESEQNLFDDF